MSFEQLAKHLDLPFLKIARVSERAGLFARSHSHYITHDITSYLENTHERERAGAHNAQ